MNMKKWVDEGQSGDIRNQHEIPIQKKVKLNDFE